MARIKGATMTHKRRKKMLKLAKGFYGCKSKHFKMAKQQVMKSGNYDLPHQQRSSSSGHELLHLYGWPEEGRHRAEPQDAVRDGHQRSSELCRSGRDREERLIKTLHRDARAYTRASVLYPGIFCGQGNKATGQRPAAETCGRRCPFSIVSIAIQLYNTTATALNCISQVCCLDTALIS